MTEANGSVMSLFRGGISSALKKFTSPSSGSKAKNSKSARWSPHECGHPVNSLKPDPNSELGKRMNRIYGGRYDAWLRSFGVTPSWESPCDTLEIHIWHGYRPNPCTVWYSIKSIIYPTNECLNIWTHLIPLLLMMWRTYNIFTTIEDPTNVIYYPFWIHCFGCCYVLFVSTFAHTFNSLSGSAQELCMGYDYSGISAYGITNVIAYELYVCPRNCFFYTNLSTIQFVICFTLAGYVSNCLSCVSRHPKCPYYLVLRLAPTMLCYAVTSLPCASRYVFGMRYNLSGVHNPMMCSMGSGEFPNLFLLHSAMFLLAAAFTITRFPEKYYPGTFDIVGHSHQFFHVFIALGLYTQNLLVENVLKELSHLVAHENIRAEDISVSPWNSLYPIAVYVIVSATLVCTVTSMLGSHLHHRRMKTD